MIESGRWHSLRRPVIYLSDHPASALLEVIVHLEVDSEDLPDSFQLLTVETPDNVAFDLVEAASLPEEWRTTPHNTQALGDRWLDETRTALLQVPSVIVPFAWNWLLNPAHPDMPKLQIVNVTRVAFDPRLFA